MLISIDHLYKAYEAKEILNDIQGVIEDNDRIGLIGANGAGKSTLLKIICGEETADTGTLLRQNDKVIGYLRQDSALDSGNTIYEEMQLAFSELLEIGERLKVLESQMADPVLHNKQQEYSRISGEYSRLSAYFEQREGYRLDVKINIILNGMGFGGKSQETVIHTLSGGEKTRLAMAKILLEQPDLLILDEPTNHLDFKTIMWLEEYLQGYKGALLIVSHDRYFLDKTVSQIWEIENKKLAAYTGNYSKFTVLKEEAILRLTKEYEMQQQEIASMKDYVARNMVRASTSKSARSRQNALDRMEIIEKPAIFNKKVQLAFDYDRETGKDVLDVSDVTLSVGSGDTAKVLSEHIQLHVMRSEKVALIGANGVGKSTLLKTIQELLPCLKGSITWGKNVRSSYYDQELSFLNPENTVISEVWDRFPRLSEHQVRSALGGVLLTGDNVYKKVSVISGGERARLAFAILMLERANVLILDEPTNHLDLSTKEILEKALDEFSGTVILVSHDRYMLNKVPTQIVEMKSDGIDIYPGKYDDYIENKKRRETQAAQITQTAREAAKPEKSDHTGYKSKDQRRQEAFLRQRIKELEGLMEQTQQSIDDLEAWLAEPGNFSDYKGMEERLQALEAGKAQLDSYMEEWIELCD